MTFTLEYWDDSPRNTKNRKKLLYGMVVHGTGSGIVVRAMDGGRNPNDVAANYYDKPQSNFPNYVVCWESSNSQLTGWVDVLGRSARNMQIGEESHQPDVFMISASDADQAWTSATGEKWNGLYRQGFGVWARYVRDADKNPVNTGAPLPKYDWWPEKWGHLSTNPADLIPGRNDNANTLSCELVVPIVPKTKRRGWKRIPFTSRQIDATAWLWAGKFHIYNLPIDEARRRIVGHEDVNPIGRGQFDPGGGKWFDWNIFFTRFDHWIEVIKKNANAYFEPVTGPAREQ